MLNSTNRLYRSRNERMIGGVCAGLGRFLGIDPTVVRLIFVFVTPFFHAMPLVYLVLLFIVPEEPLNMPVAPVPPISEEPPAPPDAA